MPSSQSWLAVQVNYALNREQFRKAICDIRNGWEKRTLWGTIGLHDIRQRYRRSTLGPFWITISTGIMIAALGGLYSQIFKMDTATYIPYLAAGLFAWGLISNIVNESCQAFNSSDYLIKQLSAPLSIYIYRVVWANLLTAAHNIWIFVLVAIWYKLQVGWSAILVIPALAIILLNGMSVGLFLGVLSARFRDIPMIVQSVMQVTFFITPIFWRTDMLPGRALLLEFNPFYHFVQILRGPMLGQVPTMDNWAAVLVTTIAGWAIALLVYTAYRWRLAYWV